MQPELLQTADIHATCDRCRKPSMTLIEQEYSRKVIGFEDEWVSVRFCPECDELLNNG